MSCGTEAHSEKKQVSVHLIQTNAVANYKKELAMRLIAKMSAKGPFRVVLAIDRTGRCDCDETPSGPFASLDEAMSEVAAVFTTAMADDKDVVDVHILDREEKIVGGVSFDEKVAPELEIVGAEEYVALAPPETDKEENFDFPFAEFGRCRRCGEVGDYCNCGGPV